MDKRFDPYREDIDNYYIGHFEKAGARIVTDRLEGDDQPNAFAWGEIMLHGYRQKNEENGRQEFKILRLLRVSGSGVLQYPQQDERIGGFSFAGPLELPTYPDGTTDPIPGFQFQFNYQALFPPYSKSDEGVPPKLDIFVGDFTWEVLETGDNRVILNVRIPAVKKVSELNVVQTFTIETLPVTFERVRESAKISTDTPIIPLTGPNTSCPNPPFSFGSKLDTNRVPIHELKLKFINFSSPSSHPTRSLDQIVNFQVAGACEVWCEQVALQFQVNPTVIDMPAHPIYAQFNSSDAAEIQTSNAVDNNGNPFLFNTNPADNEMEVYLVDSINANIINVGGIVEGATGGAAFIPLLLGNSFCLLEAAKAVSNQYLLAHEISHLLNLSHSGMPTAGNYDSSTGSVTKPGTPNNSINTLFNARVFRAAYTNPPLSPLIKTLATTAYCHPKGDFTLRDYGTDTGVEPSNPAGQVYWESPDVWNQHTINNSATHVDPLSTSNAEHMYVRLNYPNLVDDKTRVYLYLGRPGLPTGNLFNLTANNFLDFTQADTKHLQWNPNALWTTAQYPPHACVLTLATLINDLAPANTQPPGIYNPATNAVELATFESLIQNVTGSNKIVQHNLNFQPVQPAPRPFWAWAPWVEFANPFEKPVQAQLVIDATQAKGLDNLLLEFDGEKGLPIALGEEQLFPISESFGREELRILRLRAQIPAGAELGLRIPIGLIFILDGQAIGGYQHVFKINKPAVVLRDLLDYLHGALQAIALGFRTPEAEEIARQMSDLLHRRISSPEKLLRFLRGLSSKIDTLAGYIESPHDETGEAIRFDLYHLAGLLGRAKIVEDAQKIELIRYQIDRIYEVASRRARQMAFNP
jgi:hypothetical protein